MAERLDSYDWDWVKAQRDQQRSFQRRQYPYEEWFDGRMWLLTKGEDFHGKVVSIISTLGGAAARRGGRIRTCKVGTDQVAIQYLQP